MIPSRRRGSKSAIHAPTWTELFHKMATGVLKHAVHDNLSSEIVIREIPAIGKSVVDYIEKNRNVISQKSKNDNTTVISNKKDDTSIALLNKSKGEITECEFESILCPIEEITEDWNKTETEHLEESFVYLDDDDDSWQIKNVVTEGLPGNVAEDEIQEELDIEQYKTCRQLGGHNKDCTEIKDEIQSEFVQYIGNSKKSTSENVIGNINNEKMDTKNNQEEFVSTSTSSNLESSSTKIQYFQQRLPNKLDNLEFNLEEFIEKNNEHLYNMNYCQNVEDISKNDASTNTDNTYSQIIEITDAIRSHENISAQSVKNRGIFVKTFEEMNYNRDNFKEMIEAYMELREIVEMTSSFVEAVIRILKSATNLMLDIPNLPGVTINFINEQLHLLEKLENIKEEIDDGPSRFTREYDIHFPKLK